MFYKGSTKGLRRASTADSGFGMLKTPATRPRTQLREIRAPVLPRFWDLGATGVFEEDTRMMTDFRERARGPERRLPMAPGPAASPTLARSHQRAENAQRRKDFDNRALGSRDPRNVSLRRGLLGKILGLRGSFASKRAHSCPRRGERRGSSLAILVGKVPQRSDGFPH